MSVKTIADLGPEDLFAEVQLPEDEFVYGGLRYLGVLVGWSNTAIQTDLGWVDVDLNEPIEILNDEGTDCE